MKIDEGMWHVVVQDVKIDMGFDPLPVVSLTGLQLIKFHDKRRLVSKSWRVSPRGHLEPAEFSLQAVALLPSGFLPASRLLWIKFILWISLPCGVPAHRFTHNLGLKKTHSAVFSIILSLPFRYATHIFPAFSWTPAMGP